MHHFRPFSGLRQTGARRTIGRVAAASTAVLLTSSLAALPAAAAVGSGSLYYGAVQQAAQAGTANAEASSDWAGYDVTDGNYTSVSASWVQPTVTCTTGETSYSAFWVGLDGDGSQSVEQIGTSSDCDNGTPSYSAWYEFYPEASQDISATVKPGDQLTATVTAAADGTYKLVLADKTQGWTKTETGSAPDAQNASAEIIAEAPSSARAGNVLPLANFSTVKFTGVKVNGKSLAGDASAIDMADSSDTLKASTSDLTSASSGAAFTVTWKSAGSSSQQPSGIGGGFGQGGSGSGQGGTGGSGTGGFGQGGSGSSTGDGSTGLSGYPWGLGSGSDPWSTVGADGYGDGSGSSTGTSSDSSGSSGSGWEDGTSALAQAWSDWQQEIAALSASGRWAV